MTRRLLLLLVVSCVGGAGCAADGPLTRREVFAPASPLVLENPMFLAQGPEGYPQVFHQVLAAVNAYFPIARSNIYAGSIESEAVITAGLWDLARYDNYSLAELWESSLQTIRRRVVVTITPATSGGYLIDLQVLKELEDYTGSKRAHAGASVYRPEAPVQQIYDVVDLPSQTRGWIPLGRDQAMEQLILRRLRECP
jgi:hypothetical protein